jgi:flagellum-specific peptidoglycan hydrolase FlgJ
MIKKILLCFCITFFIACGSSKPVVRTTKPVVRTVKKPVAKPIVKSTESTTKPSTSNQNAQTEVLEATTKVKVTTALVLEYIAKYENIAKEDMLQYGIPASITLGQGILESGAGTGPLSDQANNHFGIKCHLEWNGPSVKYDDDSAQECFRKYSNPEESYRDHSMFLTSRTRYSGLFKLPKDDYKAWAKGLKAAGYATDPQYPAKLISLIERYDLQKYDAEVLGKSYVATKGNGVSNSISYGNAERHEVIKGDTLYSLSKKYNISIEDLKKKNNISDTGISIGQNLIIK